MTTIEWTQQTWNPTIGCCKISAGCGNCYAIQQAYRNWEMAQALPEEKRGRLKYYEGLTEKRGNRIEWTGKVAFAPEALEVPLKRKKPTTYFVNSMSDLFHESVTDLWIHEVVDVIRRCPQHVFQVLTKRVEGMQEFFEVNPDIPSNLWLGVSVENQRAANERIPWLLQVPATVRFLSCEPLLELVDIGVCGEMPDWVICGAESGRGARPFDEDWARSLRDQCVEASVPFFYKQNAKNGKKIPLPDLDGKVWAEMPGRSANVH